MIYLIYLIVFLLPIATYEPIPKVGFLSLFDLILIPMFLYWFFKKISNRDKIIEKEVFSNSFRILILASFVSTLFSASDKLYSFYGFILMGRYFFLYLIIKEKVNNIKHFKICIYLFSISLIIISVIGILQYYVGFNFQLNPNEHLEVNAQFSVLRQTFIRTTGTFQNSLNFSMYLSVGFFILIITFEKLEYLRNIFILIGAIGVVVALLQTASRGPIIFLFFTLSIYLMLYIKNNTMIFFTFIIFFGLLMSEFYMEEFNELIPDSFVLRLNQLENYENDARYSLWTNVLDRFEENILGSGYKNYDYKVDWPPYVHTVPRYLKYETTGWSPFNFHFENVYLAFYMNLGILGLIGILFLVYLFVKIPYVIYSTTNKSSEKKISMGLFLVNLSFALNMSTNPALLSDYRIMFLFWILLALTASLKKITHIE